MSPKRPWECQDGENKENDLWFKDPNMEVASIWLSIECPKTLSKRHTPRKDRNISPPLRSRNPFDAEAGELNVQDESNEDVDLFNNPQTPSPTPSPIFDELSFSSHTNYWDSTTQTPITTSSATMLFSPKEELVDLPNKRYHPEQEPFFTFYDDEDNCEREEEIDSCCHLNDENENENEHDQRGYSYSEENYCYYLKVPQNLMGPIQDLDGESEIPQTETVPITHIKRKRGEIISRSLPDRFPHQQRLSQSHFSDFNFMLPTSLPNEQQRRQQHQHQKTSQAHQQQRQQRQQSPHHSCTPSPCLSSYPFSISKQQTSTCHHSLLTTALRSQHCVERSPPHLVGLMENINEVESSGVVSP